MTKERKCSNCRHRVFYNWGYIVPCMGYEMTETVEEEIETATECDRYEEGKPSCYEEEEYTPSATHGDYSPSCPWNAPGMSINDFI